MKFTIHQTDVIQPVGFVYADSEAAALEIVRSTWTPMPDPRFEQGPFGNKLHLVTGGVGDPTRFYAEAVEEEPERVSLAALETDSDEFMDLVETAWFELMQGELMIVGENPDRTTRELVERLGGYGVETILTIGDGVQQMDAEVELEDNYVSPQELARRIAAAIAVLCYGGR